MKNMKKIATICVAAAGTALCGMAHAESLRCNGDLAGTGDSKEAVFAKCGAPYYSEFEYRPYVRTDDNDRPVVVGWVLVDYWVYNPGSGSFITYMRFENGRVASVTFGPRVP